MMDVVDVALRCVQGLEARRLPCAIGGAIALGVWCPPRATLDVDLNVFADPTRAAEVLGVLQGLGAQVEAEVMVRRLGAGEAAMLWLDRVRVDLFLPSIPFYEEAERRVVRVPFAGHTLPVLSAECIAVFKMLFFRNKDLVDLERLVAYRGAALDAVWVRSQLTDMVGEDDARVPAWDRITMLRHHP